MELTLGLFAWQVPGHSRHVSSTSFQGGGQQGDGIGSLVRLVEALEMYDNGAMESYMTEDSLESAALMKPSNHKRKVAYLSNAAKRTAIFSCKI